MSDDRALLRGVEPAPARLLEGIRDARRRRSRTVVIASEGSEELRYLDTFRANANVGGMERDHIILRVDPRAIEVWEEFLHGTQHRLKIIARLGEAGAEIHVKEWMIRHRRLLGLSDEDVAILRRLLGGARHEP